MNDIRPAHSHVSHAAVNGAEASGRAGTRTYAAGIRREFRALDDEI